jgi:transcriptional regulator GlxA family with amidase domain
MTPPTSPTRNVALLVFDDVEVLDFAGPFEVFSVTGTPRGEKPFNVYLVAEKPGPVIARNGLSLNPAYTLDDCPPPDIVIVPGGRGVRAALQNPALVDWVRAQSGRAELTLSVCTGALMLAKSDLLHGLAATTHRLGFKELRILAPDAIIHEDKRVVDNGKVILSAGVSAGIDMSLHVVGRLLGEEIARETAHYIEYDYWQPAIS